jgi:molecular chaperone HtpG
LFLSDPIDEVMLSNLHTFEEKTLTSIDAADVELPEAGGQEQPAEVAASGFPKVLSLFRAALGDKVAEVRESKRLTDSPACLVNPAGAMSSQLQKVLSMTTKDFEMSKRIFEVNPAAPLIRRLCDLSANPSHDHFIEDCGRQLYTNAMLMEGLMPDPEDAATRMQRFMDELAAQRSPIIT